MGIMLRTLLFIGQMCFILQNMFSDHEGDDGIGKLSKIGIGNMAMEKEVSRTIGAR